MAEKRVQSSRSLPSGRQRPAQLSRAQARPWAGTPPAEGTPGLFRFPARSEGGERSCLEGGGGSEEGGEEGQEGQTKAGSRVGSLLGHGDPREAWGAFQVGKKGEQQQGEKGWSQGRTGRWERKARARSKGEGARVPGVKERGVRVPDRALAWHAIRAIGQIE